MGWEHTHGQMPESTQGNGTIIKCMEREYSRGVTVVGMRVSTLMIRSLDMECLHGPMGECMKDTG